MEPRIISFQPKIPLGTTYASPSSSSTSSIVDEDPSSGYSGPPDIGINARTHEGSVLQIIGETLRLHTTDPIDELLQSQHNSIDDILDNYVVSNSEPFPFETTSQAYADEDVAAHNPQYGQYSFSDSLSNVFARDSSASSQYFNGFVMHPIPITPTYSADDSWSFSSGDTDKTSTHDESVKRKPKIDKSKGGRGFTRLRADSIDVYNDDSENDINIVGDESDGNKSLVPIAIPNRNWSTAMTKQPPVVPSLHSVESIEPDCAHTMEHSLTVLPPPTSISKQQQIVSDVFVGTVKQLPSFSRLPPDGHEFPPNFSEPISSITASVPLTTTPVIKQHGGGRVNQLGQLSTTNIGHIGGEQRDHRDSSKADNSKSNASNGNRMAISSVSHAEDAPPLPKSVPPTAGPRKVYRQDLVINVDDRRNESAPILKSEPPPSAANHNKWSSNGLEEKARSLDTTNGHKNGHMDTTTKPISYTSNHVTTMGDASKNRRKLSDPSETFRKFDGPRKPTVGLPSWRKDEKSEKSVRDKIAMFSNETDAVDKAILMGSRKSLNRSTENLLSENFGRSRTANQSSISLTKKAQSVEHLDEKSNSSRYGSSYDYAAYMADSMNNSLNADYSAPYISKAYSVENLTNNYSAAAGTSPGPINTSSVAIPSTYASLPRAKPTSVARTTSFSGAAAPPTYEDRRRSSISNLLEQRKKSMSKLRGLIIPEKTAVGQEISGQVIFDLPEIKSKDSNKGSNAFPPLPSAVSHTLTKREPVVANPKHYTPAYQSIRSPTDNSYKSIFSMSSSNNRTSMSNSSSIRTTDTKATFKKPLDQQMIMPPVKPPRTSLILSSPNSRSPNDSQHSFKHLDDSDSDSVFGSKISSPPSSPVHPNAPGKFALTRTLSSETNTSIASSTTSTLTSGSGSQASCSSVGSTPTIDMSRKISKSSSNDSYVNRKNILALAKCRSGKDESNQLGNRPHQQRRSYDDEDSTDGYDEDEVRRHAPKSKPRSSVGGSQKMVIQSPVNSVPVSQPINYRLVSSADNLVDMVINVASYVEVTSDTDGDSKNSDTSPSKVNMKFIDEERRASFKATTPEVTLKIQPKTPTRNAFEGLKSTQHTAYDQGNEMSKWVRSEVAKAKHLDEPTAAVRSTRVPAKKLSVSENILKFNQSSCVESPKTPISASVPIKITLSPKEKQRKSFDNNRSGQVFPKSEKTINQNHASTNNNNNINTNNNSGGVYHERFSSLDSLASSSSGISSSQASSLLEPSPTQLQSSCNDFGSFSSFGSNHSLITPADLQLIIEEADPPLKRADASVVVLQRDSPECSVGVTLAGGADYETKEITIHRVLTNSPAYKDGRLRKGDRILSINGLSMRGLTHRESVTVLKTPRLEVVMVVTRSESIQPSDINLSKTKLRASMGSLTSLHDKTGILSHHISSNIGSGDEKKTSYHKLSQSLDMDLDVVSNEGSSIYEENKSTDGAEDSTASSLGDEAVFAAPIHTINTNNASRGRSVEIFKDNCGLGLAIEGGLDSPSGHCPLTVKKVFMGGAAEKTGKVRVGDVIMTINEFNTEQMTRVQAWNYMKSLPCGPVKFTLT